MASIPINPFEPVRMSQQEYLELYKQTERAYLLEAIRKAQGEMIRKLQDENLKMKKDLQEVLPPIQPPASMYCKTHPLHLRPCPMCQLGREAEERTKKAVEKALEERDKKSTMVEEEPTRLDCGNPYCLKCNPKWKPDQEFWKYLEELLHPRYVVSVDPVGSTKDATASLVYSVFDKDLLPFIVVKVDDTSGIEMESLLSELKKWSTDPTTKIKEVKKSTSPASQSISGSSISAPIWTCEYCYT